MGTARLSRSDYIASEDDNVLVTGVSKDKNALAYFGYAYFYENQKTIRDIPLAGKDRGRGCARIRNRLRKGPTPWPVLCWSTSIKSQRSVLRSRLS